MDLEAYLNRINYQGPREATLATLRRLHEAHLAAMPFENLDILLGRPIQLRLEALEEKMVHNRRGGYCFEQNTLFSAMLEELGFRVTQLAARVRVGSTAIRPRTHMLLQVDIGDEAFLADVGFGGEGPPLPVRLEARAVSGQHRLVHEGSVWVLQNRTEQDWADLYGFTLEAAYPADFEMANFFTSNYPQSPFVQTLTAQRVLPDRRLILRNREFVIRDEGGLHTETVRDPEHLLEVLREHFGLAFAPGTRFSKPDF